MADEAFVDLVAEGSDQLVAPPEDSLVEIVHTAGGSYERAGDGATVSVVTAEVVPGRVATAVRWGAEVADLLSEITGLPSLFARNVYGAFGGLEWVQTAPDLAAYERAWDQVNQDERYQEKLEETAGLFVEGSGHRVLGRRVA